MVEYFLMQEILHVYRYMIPQLAMLITFECNTVTVLYLVFLSFPVFLLFIFHLSISSRYDSWDRSRSCSVVRIYVRGSSMLYRCRIHRRLLRSMN